MYRFYDTWNNADNKPVYLNEYSVKYKNANYLSVGEKFTIGNEAYEMYWTSLLTNNNYIVPAKSSMQVLSTKNEDW